MYGNMNKIYLPYFDRDQVVVLDNPYLHQSQFNCDFRGYFSIDLEYRASNIQIIDCKNVKDLFQSISDDLTVKEVLQIVQDKLTKRENKNGN